MDIQSLQLAVFLFHICDVLLVIDDQIEAHAISGRRVYFLNFSGRIAIYNSMVVQKPPGSECTKFSTFQNTLEILGRNVMLKFRTGHQH